MDQAEDAKQATAQKHVRKNLELRLGVPPTLKSSGYLYEGRPETEYSSKTC
jgi:hypothetical protein